MLNPEERTTFSDFPNAVVRLATQLPQLKLDTKLDKLRTEALDFQMASSENLPAINDVDVFSPQHQSNGV